MQEVAYCIDLVTLVIGGIVRKMQTVYLKEHEGIVQNSVGQYSSVTSSAAPWWSAFGSQSVYGTGESCGQMKPLSLELSNYMDQLAPPSKQLVRGVEQLLDKGHTNQFTIFPGIQLI